MTILVMFLCMAFPQVSFTRKSSVRDKKGKVVRDERTNDLRVSIGGRKLAAPLVTALYTSLTGWAQISGGSG